MKGIILLITISIFISSYATKNTQKNNQIKFSYAIYKQQLGNISTNETIASALSKINESFKYQETNEDIDSETNENSSYWTIFNEINEIQFLIHPFKNETTNEFYVYSIEVIDSAYFIAEYNIRVGCNFKDLKSKIPLGDIYFNYDDGLFIKSKNCDYGFGIKLDEKHSNSLGQFDYDSINDIPDYFTIKTIVIY